MFLLSCGCLCSLSFVYGDVGFKFHLDEHNFRSEMRHMLSCETHLTTVINDWAKIWTIKEFLDTFMLIFE